ncbi:AAA family ATPase [Xylophilus rhododendri]|uniref:AAA family ATPase n=1 Tax=Xylophilus rhododendri TaxID=2697032 RepID=A0A857J6D2_9BURK|nr:AAA family ATPase [Xylophilus rhododendri]QHI98793.1 AAA family ATPase [Xylophilus rhododendri]
MYASAFGLQQAPFSIAPDPRYLFMSERHREALAHLLYGLGASGGFVLLTGEIGTGKTTVCRCFLEQMPEHCQVAYVYNPKQSAIELLRTINDEFGVPHAPAAPGSAETIKDCIDPLNAFLLASHAAGRNTVLVIDEAQNLSIDVLEQLRLLTNLETTERKLLQIVLIGQPELRELLARPELEQLAQRVVARFHLDALSLPEVEAYVSHRLAVAGWSGALPFDRRVLARIHQLTGGVPRRINLLCDRALLGAYSAGVRSVDRRMLGRAALEVFGAMPQRAARPAGQRMLRAGATVVAVAGLACAAAFAVWTNRPHAVAAASPAAAAAAPAIEAVPTSAAGVPEPAATAAAPDAATAPPASDFRLAAVLPGLAGSEDTALRELAGAWDAGLPPAAVNCNTLAARDLRCFRASRAGLDLLHQLDRPAVLTLHFSVGSSRRQAYVLLRGLDARGVILELDGQPRSVTAAELARWWRGELLTLWRASAKDSTTLDARLAQALPDLPAAMPRAERISRFQLAHGLPPDGMAGPLTAMRLNRASGVQEPRLQGN